MRVLVVDDSRAMRIIIASILRELGREVIEAGNGREAIDVLVNHPDIEVALVDWNMPVMNGIELIRHLRSQREYDRLRIMMVTTESESEQVATAFAAGANEYVMKPFTKEILMAKLSLLDVGED